MAYRVIGPDGSEEVSWTGILTPRSLLQDDLSRRLAELPLRFETAADYELARALFEQTVNWYFGTRENLDREPQRYRVMSWNHVHIVRQMDQDEAELVLGSDRDIIHIRALLNAIQELGRMLVPGQSFDQPVTLSQIRNRIAELIMEQKGT